MSADPVRVQLVNLEDFLEQLPPSKWIQHRRERRRARRDQQRSERKKKRKTRATRRLELVATGALPTRPVRRSLGWWPYMMRAVLEDLQAARAPLAKGADIRAWAHAREETLRRAELNMGQLVRVLELET